MYNIYIYIYINVNLERFRTNARCHHAHATNGTQHDVKSAAPIATLELLGGPPGAAVPRLVCPFPLVFPGRVFWGPGCARRGLPLGWPPRVESPTEQASAFQHFQTHWRPGRPVRSNIFKRTGGQKADHEQQERLLS